MDEFHKYNVIHKKVSVGQNYLHKLSKYAKGHFLLAYIQEQYNYKEICENNKYQIQDSSYL